MASHAYRVMWRALLLVPSVAAGNSPCEEISICEGVSRKNSSIDWTVFYEKSLHSPSEETLLELADLYSADPAVSRECRMGLAYVFRQLSLLAYSRENFQRSHNMNQLAMAMLWDTTRTHMHCLDSPVWGVDWLGQFMHDYLSLASQLKRHEDQGLPPPHQKPPENINPSKIAIATVCAYDPQHNLYGIDKISHQNRQQYVKKHGYVSIFKSVNEDAPGRHPVWTAIALPLKLMKESHFDFVMWMDCDAMFIDQSKKIEEIINMYPGKDIYISEDGRGLSGGNWIVRNSPYSVAVLESVINNLDFDLWDLKDQFGLLWTLLRPSINVDSSNSLFFGYPDNVALIPQRLINAYPWALCRPSHHCFEDGKDFIVSFITLGSLSKEMAWNLLLNFFSRN